MNAVLTVLGVIAGCTVITFNQSRLSRNDALRNIPKVVAQLKADCPDKTNRETIKTAIETQYFFLTVGVIHKPHREEIREEFYRQCRRAFK